MATLRTVTVKSSGGDYTSLNAALVGESADLVSLDRLLRIEPYAMNDTTAAVTGTGYTVDPTHYIDIVVPEGERHAGVYDLSKYRITVGAYKYPLEIRTSHTRVTGLQTEVSSSNGYYAYFIQTDDITGVVIDRCLAKGPLAGSYCPSGSMTVRNSIGRGWGTGRGVSIHHYNSTFLLTAENCVLSGYADGLYRGYGNITARNCYSGDNTGGDYTTTAYAGTFTKETCASEDATGSTGLQNIPYSSTSGAYFNNVTPGSEDFRISNPLSALKDVGTDLSASFTTDIAGNTRTTPWDIGAFKAATGTPGGPTTGTGNITGYAEVAGVGSAMWVATAAAAASSTAAAVGARVAVAVATSAGVSTSTVVGAAVRPSVAASAGSATVAAVGAAPAVAVAASVSSSTAAAIGAAVAVGVGSSAGAATAAATSTSVVPTIVSAVGASASTSTAPAVGAALWSSIGQCLALAASAVVGVALAATVAVSVGRATAPGVGRATAVAVAASAGSAGVLGRSSAGLIQPATGAAIGSATVSATGAAVAVSRATSDGIAAAPGAGVAVAVTRGVAVGQGAATGTAVSTIAATGTAIATSTALGCAAAVAVAAGSSAGSSTAAGTALPPVAHMRVALTSCGPSADFTSTGPTVALASRGPSVEFGIPFAAEE